MTHKQRFIDTLKCKKIGGHVPHFEMVFFLTMEALGKVHPSHRSYHQWFQMSSEERKLHIDDCANLYIDVAKRYGHSAIFVHPNPNDLESTQMLLEVIREKTGDEYYLTMHGDATWAIPDGDDMVDFSVKMFEEPDLLIEETKIKIEKKLKFARDLADKGHLLDGFMLCSDYAFNTNPFYSDDMFAQIVAPYLKELIDGYRKMDYYTIKHTDGNISPILGQIAECKPDGIHSIDPQGGMSLLEARKIVGDDICLVGNVNCGLLQSGTDEECEEDILRALHEGMSWGKGYIFSTSNTVYAGMPLQRYEKMVDLWRKHGIYTH